MSDVYVLGIDMMKFGRFPNSTVPQLGAQAALMALDDAGLTISQMESVYCANLGQANAMVGQRILHEIGQTGIPVVNCANACATGATALRGAWMSIKAGVYDLQVTGDLDLHGVSRSLTLPLRVEVAAGTLTATGKTTLRQSDFGMKPVSAGGGTVKVKNEIAVDLRIVARAGR